MLQTLIYMIRCAYEHDLMHSKWNIKEPYRQQLKIELQGENVELDLSGKDGHPFDIEDIGGHEIYFEIKEQIYNMIEKS